MRSGQLDLFDWKPACQVISFPPGRMVGRARWIVGLTSKTSAGAMDRIWNDTLDELEDAMILAGVAIEDRARQLRAFADLCDRELLIASYRGQPQFGGDAA